MRTTTITMLFTTIALAGCFTEGATTPQDEFQTSMSSSEISCTPGAETCDWGCNFDGSDWNGPTPTTDDCIIRCNAAGNRWDLVQNCGWAQNFPYSSSCLDSQPHPICQNN